MLVNDLVNEYLTFRSLSQSTQRAYTSVISTFTADTTVVDLEDITEALLLAWRDDICQRASSQTWNTYRRHLNVLLNFAAKRSYIPTNPLSEISSVSAEIKDKTLNPNEIRRCKQRLMKTWSFGWLWCCVIDTFYFTAMRRRQLVGLHWQDINWERQEIHLKAESSKTKRCWTIGIDDRLLPGLQELRVKTEKITGNRVDPNAQVFKLPLFNNQYRCDELSAEQVSKSMMKISKSTGIRISAHRLRHTYATEAVNLQVVSAGDAPVSIKAIQNQLGHTSISTTLGYVRPNLDQQRLITSQLPSI